MDSPGGGSGGGGSSSIARRRRFQQQKSKSKSLEEGEFVHAETFRPQRQPAPPGVDLDGERPVLSSARPLVAPREKIKRTPSREVEPEAETPSLSAGTPQPVTPVSVVGPSPPKFKVEIASPSTAQSQGFYIENISSRATSAPTGTTPSGSQHQVTSSSEVQILKPTVTPPPVILRGPAQPPVQIIQPQEVVAVVNTPVEITLGPAPTPAHQPAPAPAPAPQPVVVQEPVVQPVVRVAPVQAKPVAQPPAPVVAAPPAPVVAAQPAPAPRPTPVAAAPEVVAVVEEPIIPVAKETAPAAMETTTATVTAAPQAATPASAGVQEVKSPANSTSCETAILTLLQDMPAHKMAPFVALIGGGGFISAAVELDPTWLIVLTSLVSFVLFQVLRI